MLNLSLWEIVQLWWLFPFILSLLGGFLSLWIVVPAPNWTLLPFGVCAPEISAWLVVVNAIALSSTLWISQSWLFNLILVCSLLGLILSLLPLVQLPATNKRFAEEMERVLGTDYLENISQDVRDKMRLKPFALANFFRGVSRSNIQIERGIVFASPDGVELKLNTYRPSTIEKNSTLIIVYGGAWRSGSPDDYEDFSCYIAAQNYTVIAIDYRHAPKHKFPAQLKDVKTALQYIKNNAKALSVDLDRMAIMGRSAGGHLATLAAYKQDIIRFRSILSYYSPVNLAEEYYDLPVPDPIDVRDVLENFLGGTPEEQPELYQQASPINYLQSNLPPSLLIYAGRDHLVQAKRGQKLYDKLISTNNAAIYLEIPWAEHAFDAVFFGISNQLALYYTERFLASTLQ